MEASHPSFGPIKALASQISFMIPDNIQIFGENMFGIHSIEYDKLESYFYIFGVLEDETSWLEWDKVKELSIDTGIPHVPEIARRQFTSMAELQAYIEGRMKLPSCCGMCVCHVSHSVCIETVIIVSCMRHHRICRHLEDT
jgi:hypothetical protein